MIVSTFYDKLNKVDGNIHVVEEEIHLTNGVYEAELQHDNINEATFAVFTGPKLTGNRLESYTLSTPSLAPWKRIVRVYADVPVVYISYETDGDTVEGDDINRVQESIVATQEALNAEEGRAQAAEGVLRDGLQEETNRAIREESRLDDRINAESGRALGAEQVLRDDLAAESQRAKGAETTLKDNLADEVDRATAEEDGIRATINANKPNWDDKYTRNEVDNKFSALETAIDWKEAVDTYADLSTAYPHPDDGWTVNVKDTDYTYRWSGAAWIAISANAIPKATQGVDGLLSKEDKACYDDAYSKRHTHGNKSTLDKLTETLLANWTAAYTHISNKSNPHGVTKSQVGLGSVPNVATNDQEPTFAQATTLVNLTSGEKLGVAMGKIAKAIADFITHKADTVQHITATERADWNDADTKKHTHSNKGVVDKLTQAMLDKLAGIASGAEVNVQPDWDVTDTGSDAYIRNKPTSLPASDVQAWAKASSKPAYVWTEIGSKPSTFPPAAHTHTKSQITDMPTKLSQFANDSGYLTAADVDTSQNHTHANKTVLDKITQALLDTWNGKAGTSVATQTANGLMAAADKKKLDGVAANANNFVHLTTPGNKHIPSGGASGQILRWSADGTAVWGADNNTTYAVFKAATSSAAGGTGLVPAPAAGAQLKYLRADGTWQTPPDTKYTHPNSGVTAGTYRSVIVNAQGHVTAGTNPTTLSGYGITDAAAKNHNHDSTYLKKGAVTWNDLKGV